jgi:hypothetical protein
MRKTTMQRNNLLLLIQQAKEVIFNLINIYQFSLENLEYCEDFLLVEKEKQKYMQLQSSYYTLEMYEKNLMYSELVPIVLVPSLYKDFIIWIKNIERICYEGIDKIPNNIFQQIYNESYSEIYCSANFNQEKVRESLEEENDIEDDDW